MDVKIGQKIGEWEVIERFVDDFTSEYFCLKCKCNKKKIISKHRIKNIPSFCPSCSAKKIGYKQHKDMTGKKIGSWTVIKKAESKANSHGFRWVCQCFCGKIGIVAGGALRNGRSQGCQSCRASKRWQRMRSSNK